MKKELKRFEMPASNQAFILNDDEGQSTSGAPLSATPATQDNNGGTASPSIQVFVALRSGRLGTIALDMFLGTEVILEGACQEILDQTAMAGLELGCEFLGLPKVPRSTFRDLVRLTGAENPIDSAQQWLSDLPLWDGRQRIERFLPDYLGTMDTPYERAVSRYVLSAMVARTMEPGCKADMMPVLVGPQGAKKTSAIKLLAPDEDYCADVCLTDHPKELAHTIFGHSVLIWENVRGIRGKPDFERVKAFLTRQYLEVRSQDKRIGMDRYPCRYVVFGTSNTGGFLRDTTGNRRFLPFRVGPIDLEKLAADKLQLWAEALYVMRMREAGGLSLVDYEDAERLAPAEHQKFLRQGLWYDSPQLESWLKRQLGIFTTGEALEAIGLGARATQADRQEMARSLRQLGYDEKRQRVNGKSLKRWFRP